MGPGPGTGNHNLGNKQHNECCNVNPATEDGDGEGSSASV